MNNWHEVKLGDVVEIGRGSSPRPIKDERYFINGTIPWVKIADATASGKYIFKTQNFVNEFGASFSRYLKKGSIILSASGVSLGIPRILGVDGCIHDGWLYFSDFKGINAEWLYYRLTLLQDYFLSVAYGAAIQNVNTDMLRETKILLPDIRIQKKIASTLNNYDDLIQTNQQRIALLEEAAQRLYDEWFVKLRFPNYEQVPVVEGVPEGWEKIPLGEVLILQRGFDLASDKRQTGEIPIFASTGINGFHKEAMVNHPTVITGRSGTLGEVLYSSSPCWPLNTTLWIKEFKKSTPIFAFFLLKSLNLASMNGGSAVPTLNRNDIHRLITLSPSLELINRFEAITLYFFKQIDLLKIQNQKLTQARDELLPRLMSGQLDVSQLS